MDKAISETKEIMLQINKKSKQLRIFHDRIGGLGLGEDFHLST